MIADRLRALVAELRTPRPTWDDNVTFVSERDIDIADRLDQILAEDAGGAEEPDCLAHARKARTHESAALWMIAHTLRQISDRLPEPPPQEPQP